MATLKGLPETFEARWRAWGLDRAWPFLAVGLAALVALGLTWTAGFPGNDQTREIQELSLPSGEAAPLGVEDQDQDGLPDSLEVYVFGTDPENPDTSGDGIPDGYLADHGYDPLDPNVHNQTVDEPPPHALAQGMDAWPDRYRLTVLEFYQHTRPAGYEPGDQEPFWNEEDVPSPREWDKSQNGIPDAWFLAAGLDPFNADLDEVAPGSEDTLTVAQNWELGTNPALADTDQDGIPDADEPDVGTDPLAYSTLDADVADGWLLAKGLDPLDASVLFEDASKDGLTTAETFRVSRQLLPQATVDEIVKQGLDPFDWDTSGDGIPDGWLVKHGLDPLDASVGDEVTQRATDFEDVRFVDEAPGDEEPLGEMELTVRDEYEVGRPPGWSEAEDGVWWGGTAPDTPDTDGDGLPDAIEIRGWYVQLTLEASPGAEPETVHVTSNPTQADTSGDGLDDWDQYHGETVCPNGEQRSFPPLDPSRRDSAFSGLDDFEEVCGFTIDGERYDFGAPNEGGLDPTSVDTAGSLLPDGEEARYWHERAQNLQDPYPFPHAEPSTSVEAAREYPRHAGASPMDLAARAGPDGDWDGDGVANLLDPDSSSALSLEGSNACPQGSQDPTSVFLLDGPQVDPGLYRFTDLASEHPRSPTDPLIPDTDGDGLPDAWEHRNAEFLDEQDRWTVDPANPETGGTRDGEANHDGDETRYLAPPGEVNTYEHNNLEECRAGTDPLQASSDEDGVPDGWKVFWGLRYPTLVSAGDPLVGELTDEETDLILERSGQVSIAPGQPLLGTPPWLEDAMPVPYARYVELATGGSEVCDQREELVEQALEEVSLAAWEHVAENPREEAPCVRTADDQTRLLLEIRGEYEAGWGALAGTGANPYLEDTSRDGVPDWWKALIQHTAGNPDLAPSPLEEEADEVLAGESLTLAEHYEAWLDALAEGSPRGGPDPTVEDSSGDGLTDAETVNAGFDPKDPFTIERLGEDGRDSDGDGIGDLGEIRGWAHEGPARSFKTNPINPDSDHDGLLDREGTTVSTTRFDELGIAHRDEESGVRYLGEALYRSDPTQLDSSGDGIPDGWQAYYVPDGSPDPTQDASGLERFYDAGKPSWWEETRHGVWWWGLPPNAPFCQDLDGDGLNDDNGEDPFPANEDNLYQHGGFETQDPSEARAYIQASSNDLTVRERAQAWAEGAGNPLPHREHLEDGCPEHDAPPFEFTSLTIEPSPPVMGEPVTVTGTVNAPPQASHEHVTVILSALDATPERALGVAFTGPDGSFTIETTFTPDHDAHVPPEGLYLGTRGEPVSWTARLDDVDPGDASHGTDNQLVVWTYNTTNAKQALHEPETPFHASTTLTADAPTGLRTGEPGPVNTTLTDALNEPLPDQPVTLTWDATDPPTEVTVQTDAEGDADATLPPADEPGPTNLTVRFDGTDTLHPAQTTIPLPVQDPTNLTLTPDVTAAAAGDPLPLQGTLTKQGDPLPHAPVQIRAGQATANTTTGPDGTFQETLPLPRNVQPGSLTLTAQYLGTSTVQPATGHATIEILGSASLDAPDHVTIPQRQGAHLTGHLHDATGTGIPGDVTLTGLDAGPLTSAASPDGAFRIVTPPDQPRGTYTATLTAHPADDHAPTTHQLTATVQSQARIHLDPLPASTHPGDDVTLTGHLTDAHDDPLAHEALLLDAFDTHQPVTDEDGRFEATLTVPLDAELGPHEVTLDYAPEATPTVLPTTTTTALAVKDPTHLDVHTEHARMAHPHVAGTLTTPSGGVPGQPVTVQLANPETGTLLHETTTRTSPDGAYNATFPANLADHALPATATVHFPGTHTLDDARHETTVNLTTPLRWDAAPPSTLPHNEPHTVEGTVHDAAGAPIHDATVVARLGNTTLQDATVKDGRFSLTLTAPPTTEPGEHHLTIMLEPAGLHVLTPLEGPVTVTTTPTVTMDLDTSLDAGEPYRATARVTDQAQRPLSNVTLVHWVRVEDEQATRPATLHTDENGQARISGTVPEDTPSDEVEIVVLAHDTRLTEEAAVASSANVAFPAAMSLAPGVLALVVLSTIAAGAYLAHRRQRQLDEMHDIVEDLLDDLVAGNEYEASVIRAYRVLNQHLEEHGFLERPDHTAREYLNAVRQAMPLRRESVDAFISLFEEVRYSSRVPGPQERREATELLRRLLTELEEARGWRS